jgi:hypothetical protein
MQAKELEKTRSLLRRLLLLLFLTLFGARLRSRGTGSSIKN